MRTEALIVFLEKLMGLYRDRYQQTTEMVCVFGPLRISQVVS